MNWFGKKEEKRRMKRLFEESGKWYRGCYRNDKRNGVFTRAYPYSTNRKNFKKWLRRQSNRKFRRNEGEILNGCFHKKQYDLWWELY